MSSIMYILPMGIVNKLKLARIEAENLTQEKLANLVNCSRQTINSIEKGKFNPSVELALKLAQRLNKKVEELFSLDEENK